MPDNAHNSNQSVQSVSAERIRDELLKILASKNPVTGLDLLMDSGLMQEIVPEIVECNSEKGDQDPIWHPEGNTWVHTKMVVEILAEERQPVEVILAGLLHDIGKPCTQVRLEDGRITNHLHDEIGGNMAEEICRRLRLTNDQTDLVSTLVHKHMKMHRGKDLRRAKLIRMLEHAYINEMIALQHADAMGTASAHRHEKSLRDFYMSKVCEFRENTPRTQALGATPLVSGSTLLALGYKPGPRFRVMLEEAMDAQREGAFSTSDEARDWVIATFTSDE